MEKIKVHIVKIGGNVVNDPQALKAFLRDFAEMEGPKILIHGGGKKASELSVRMGVEPKMVDGRRITDGESLEVATMVYAGLINKDIVAQLQAMDCQALGFSGADGNSILAHKRPVGEVDFGFVGDVDQVNDSLLALLLDAGLSPVFCALTHDGAGQMLNTNADTIASEIAKALAQRYSVKLIYCFELPGVLTDKEDHSTLIETLSLDEFETLKEKGVVSDGMLPKLLNCFQALDSGVSEVVLARAEFLRTPELKHTKIVKA